MIKTESDRGGFIMENQKKILVLGGTGAMGVYLVP